jgi:ribulose-phosphate 3-epimerase
MLDNPEDFIAKFAKAGADNITVHAEVREPLAELSRMVRDQGKLFGVSVKPDTSLDPLKGFLNQIDILLIMTVHPGFGGQQFISSMVPKIAEAARLKKEHGYLYEIEVDGGLNSETVKIAVENGATMIVAGEYIFGSSDYKKAVDSLRPALTK